MYITGSQANILDLFTKVEGNIQPVFAAVAFAMCLELWMPLMSEESFTGPLLAMLKCIREWVRREGPSIAV